MKRLLLSFIFSILTANSAYATATEAKTDHAIKLIKTFEADKVDQVINSSVSTFICKEGSNAAIDNERKLDHPGSRAPGFVKGKGKFQLFKEEVEKGNFRDSYHKEGDVYSYSSEEKKALDVFGLPMESTTLEFVFERKSKTEEKPFEHEFGLTVADVKKEILNLINSADENYQTDERAFIVRVKDKAYLINLDSPLLSNPIYKVDVNTGNVEYGLSNVRSRSKDQTPFVSMSK
ncbi:MAG: hypothetical protein ACJAT2_003039 [Bacteriovoracaceae bacterium]|jgi:hypothetical protein